MQKPSPVAVFVVLPREYRRFPGSYEAPKLPDGASVIWVDEDIGPAVKALGAAQHLVDTEQRLIYCDDDWIYGQGWAKALLTNKPIATTGQAWDIARLKRRGHGADIAQGFSGVCVDPSWFCGPESTPPENVMEADDIWLSALLAKRGVPICSKNEARSKISPAFDDEYGLQNTMINGVSRNQAYKAAAQCAHQRFGIWRQM